MHYGTQIPHAPHTVGSGKYLERKFLGLVRFTVHSKSKALKTSFSISYMEKFVSNFNNVLSDLQS